jgi:hypothetical protein
MVIKNPDLIPELTEYQQQPDPNRDVNAALTGFGTDYNVAIPKIDSTQPANKGRFVDAGDDALLVHFRSDYFQSHRSSGTIFGSGGSSGLHCS